jgi:hypothetical protein
MAKLKCGEADQKLFGIAIEHSYASIELGAIESRSPSMATKTLAQAIQNSAIQASRRSEIMGPFFAPHLFPFDAVALRMVFGAAEMFIVARELAARRPRQTLVGGCNQAGLDSRFQRRRRRSIPARRKGEQRGVAMTPY